MDEQNFHDQVTSTLSAIQALLARSIEIQQEDTEIDRSIHDLEKKRTETSSDMLRHTELTNTLADQRTDMARERTGLVREQTRLSTKSTELSVIRTDMARERSGLAGQRTDLAVLRTDLSRSRTSLADQRNKMANTRTEYSIKRTSLAGSRTILSNIRTSLAQGRTHLALIRTGLAFFSIAIAFFRMFGLSWWSVFDGVLALGSLVITGAGIVGYKRATGVVKNLQQTFEAQEETTV
jgi:uncharacterized membrane protein YidH (DUF202 family)